MSQGSKKEIELGGPLAQKKKGIWKRRLILESGSEEGAKGI